MYPKLDPCPEFQELFSSHQNQCKRCQKALKEIEQIEWKGEFKFFCPAGTELINSHLVECEFCAASTSLYLQQFAEALITTSDKPIQ
jgi:hypothetical protein